MCCPLAGPGAGGVYRIEDEGEDDGGAGYESECLWGVVRVVRREGSGGGGGAATGARRSSAASTREGGCDKSGSRGCGSEHSRFRSESRLRIKPELLP